MHGRCQPSETLYRDNMGDGQIEYVKEIEKGRITIKEIRIKTGLENVKSSDTVVSKKDKKDTNIASIRV